MQARSVRLKTRPHGMPVIDDFQIVEVDITEPRGGQIQVQNLSM